MPWEQAASLAELEHRPTLFKGGSKQIAVFAVEGRVFAVDNRCPHEGYPLIQGTVDESCLLTCNWHNWKFRLADGQCVLGGDHVRTYPVRVEDGTVWINTNDPPCDVLEARIVGGLRAAFEKRDFGRICREVARLRFQGLDALLAIRKAVEWSHDRFEFGFGHAWAATADWLALCHEFEQECRAAVRARQAENDTETENEAATSRPPTRNSCHAWDRQLVCLAEAIDHMALDALRHPPYPYADAGAPFDRNVFLTAVELENHKVAEALVRSGLDDGLHWSDLEETFTEAALAHYNDFGHSVIFVQKTGQFLELAGHESEPHLLPALARHLCYTTREDLLPEFRSYAPLLNKISGRLRQAEADNATDGRPEVPYPASTREAFAWLIEHSGVSIPAIYDALLEALARNLLHFDLRFQEAYDRPVSENVGWLDFTHGLTFANAVRNMCERYPKFWPQGLLQMACFVGRNRSYLNLDLEESDWLVEDHEAFLATAKERLLDHGLRTPIFSAHLLKTTLAVRQELPYASASCQKYLLASLNRFLNSPLKQKHTRRLARQAINLIRLDFS